MPVTWFEPARARAEAFAPERSRVVLFFHGGGYIAFDSGTHSDLACRVLRALVDRAGGSAARGDAATTADVRLLSVDCALRALRQAAAQLRRAGWHERTCCACT